MRCPHRLLPLHRTEVCGILTFCRFSACCSTIRLFDFVPCSGISGSSHPISSWLGGKPVVAFAKLLCTNVATASQLLQSDWLVIIRHRYCSTHWFLCSEILSVWGWNAVDRFWRIPNSFMRAWPKCDVKQGSQLLMTFSGSPNHWKMWSRYSFAI